MITAPLFSARFKTCLAEALVLVDELGMLRRLSFLEDRLEDDLETQILADESAYASHIVPDARRTAPAREALEKFLDTQRWELDLPFQVRGTPFQNIVWDHLRFIPYGETQTYAEVAVAIGSPLSVPAVARAVATNPVALAIPCHRAVGNLGELTGSSGGVKVKQGLLELEQRCLQYGLAPPPEEPEGLEAQITRRLGEGLRIQNPRQ